VYPVHIFPNRSLSVPAKTTCRPLPFWPPPKATTQGHRIVIRLIRRQCEQETSVCWLLCALFQVLLSLLAPIPAGCLPILSPTAHMSSRHCPH
jgi:hypothetical protein